MIRRGRRPGRENPTQRERHVRALLMRRMKVPTGTIAKVHSVSKRTIQLWIRQALTYDDPRVRCSPVIGQLFEDCRK